MDIQTPGGTQQKDKIEITNGFPQIFANNSRPSISITSVREDFFEISFITS